MRKNSGIRELMKPKGKPPPCKTRARNASTDDVVIDKPIETFINYIPLIPDPYDLPAYSGKSQAL
ncbi:MAG: hypothetical protein COX19_17860 [Desulfobacterales bacterium CG23_combo_of_CG06-09_8_20_14_all_51_8]|nr:MAG: hypothetical protein COX19_17860 [Desulfobacterales bacterium CG23_combo_of_CG06-09_8_20_14_all_51_8]